MTINGDGIWKFATMFLSGVVLSLLSAYFITQKDVVTKTDLNASLAMQQRQLDEQNRSIVEMKASIVQLDVDTGRIAEHLGVPAHPVAH